MSKSPLKQADASLVQGAYRAATAGIPQGGQDGMGKAMDSIQDSMSDVVDYMVQHKKEQRKRGDDLAKGIEDTAGGLGKSWLTACQGECAAMHKDYGKAAAWGKKNKMAEGMQDLNSLSAEVASVKDLNNEISQAQLQKDWSGSVSDKEQHIFNAFMDDNTEKRIHKDENGNRVFQVYVGEDYSEDGWMSTNDISRMADEHKKDYKTMVDIRKQAVDVVEKAKNDALRNKEEGYTGGGYDKKKAMAKMDNTLRNANLKSLMHDDVLENGVPFVDAIKDNPEITGMTYQSLGIDPNLGSEQGATRAGNEALIGKSTIDLDGDGKVSEQELSLLSDEDRQLIVDAMINPENENYDEERTRAEMAKYFTNFVAQNYENEYTNSGGKYHSDAVNQYGDANDPQGQADNFMKQQGII